MTDTELLDLIAARLKDGSDDYLHVYMDSHGNTTAEVDGAWLTRPTLREALIAMYSEVNQQNCFQSRPDDISTTKGKT